MSSTPRVTSGKYRTSFAKLAWPEPDRTGRPGSWKAHRLPLFAIDADRQVPPETLDVWNTLYEAPVPEPPVMGADVAHIGQSLDNPLQRFPGGEAEILRNR